MQKRPHVEFLGLLSQQRLAPNHSSVTHLNSAAVSRYVQVLILLLALRPLIPIDSFVSEHANISPMDKGETHVVDFNRLFRWITDPAPL